VSGSPAKSISAATAAEASAEKIVASARIFFMVVLQLSFPI
jgi:hypothetical protein